MTGTVPRARPALARRLLAEAVGTAMLVTVMVGSGITAAVLSPDDAGLQLLMRGSSCWRTPPPTAPGLAVLILLFGPPIEQERRICDDIDTRVQALLPELSTPELKP